MYVSSRLRDTASPLCEREPCRPERWTAGGAVGDQTTAEATRNLSAGAYENNHHLCIIVRTAVLGGVCLFYRG